MGYAKKKMEGIYLDWYNIIGSHIGDNPKLDEYSPISGDISSLDWQGENKESVCNTIKEIDSTCQTIYGDISENIEKVNYCTGPIYGNLSSLKLKYDEYNGYIDDYEAALAELERLKNLEESEENKTNEEVS